VSSIKSERPYKSFSHELECFETCQKAQKEKKKESKKASKKESNIEIEMGRERRREKRQKGRKSQSNIAAKPVSHELKCVETCQPHFPIRVLGEIDHDLHYLTLAPYSKLV